MSNLEMLFERQTSNQCLRRFRFLRGRVLPDLPIVLTFHHTTAIAITRGMQNSIRSCCHNGMVSEFIFSTGLNTNNTHPPDFARGFWGRAETGSPDVL
jgi:hypothetical protein